MTGRKNPKAAIVTAENNVCSQTRIRFRDQLELKFSKLCLENLRQVSDQEAR